MYDECRDILHEQIMPFVHVQAGVDWMQGSNLYGEKKKERKRPSSEDDQGFDWFKVTL